MVRMIEIYQKVNINSMNVRPYIHDTCWNETYYKNSILE